MYKEIKFNSRQKAVVNGFVSAFAATIVEMDDNILIIRLEDDNVVLSGKSGEEIRSSLRNGIAGPAICDTPKYRQYQVIGYLRVFEIPNPHPMWDENVAPSGATFVGLEIEVSDYTVFPTLWGSDWGSTYYANPEGLKALQNCGVINPADRFEDL